MSALAGGQPTAEVLAEHLAAWPGLSAAAAIRSTAPVGTQLTAAQLASTGSAVMAGPVDRPFAWASVTKLLVSLAVWVAVEEGTVSFEDPAGPPGSTLAHLLAHASGLPFEGTRPIAPPGRRRTYSNTGIEIAASHLAAAAGMPFDEYLGGAVIEPLGMTGTVLDGSPAHGASGPLVDLLALAAELMSPTLVSPATHRQVTSVAFGGLSGVLPGFGRHDPCDWGLGPEVRGHKSPHWTGTSNSAVTFGHFGQSGSLLWVDPDANIALVCLSETAFGPWAKQAWPMLADAVLSCHGRWLPDGAKRPER